MYEWSGDSAPLKGTALRAEDELSSRSSPLSDATLPTADAVQTPTRLMNGAKLCSSSCVALRWSTPWGQLRVPVRLSSK